MGWDNIKARSSFLVKRNFFGLGTSKIFDKEGRQLLLYAKAKFMKGEGFRIFTSEEMTDELIFAKRERGGEGQGDIGKNESRLKKAFTFIYSVTDSKTGEVIGGFQRKTLKSILKDTWLILAPDGREAGQITEKSGLGAALSRLISLVPQKYNFEMHGRLIAEMDGRFAFFAPKYALTIKDPGADIRLILTGAALIGGIEGKQGQNS
jgi:hypothetical protein